MSETTSSTSASARKARPRIGLVGPCGAGKSTLAGLLRALGYQVHHIAQEHSHVPDMWQRLVHPDVLVFLDVSFETATRRRDLHWTRQHYEAQQKRLAHARAHADLYILTDDLTPQQVLDILLQWLREQGYPFPKQKGEA